MGLSQHKSLNERSETSAEITHLALLNVFIISFFTRVPDGYISDLVS